MNKRLLLALLLLVFAGCDNSRDFQPTGLQSGSGTRSVTFRLNLAQAQGTDTVPSFIDGFKVVSSGPSNLGASSLAGEIRPGMQDVTIEVRQDTASCQLFLTENGTPRLTGLFPLPPGSGPVLFDRPALNPYFGGVGATSLTMRLSQQPLLKDEPVKITVETQDGVDVTKDGEFEVDPPGAVVIDEEGNATGLQTATGVQIRFRLRLPQFDLAVGCDDGPCVSLYDSSRMEEGPVNQFVPFDAFTSGVRVSVGDLDGDGRNDVVCRAGSTFRVFDQQGIPLAEYQLPGQNALVAAGDVDDDLTDEIVVVDPEKGLASLLTYSISENPAIGVRNEVFFDEPFPLSFNSVDMGPGFFVATTPERLLKFDVGGLVEDVLEVEGARDVSTVFVDNVPLLSYGLTPGVFRGVSSQGGQKSRVVLVDTKLISVDSTETELFGITDFAISSDSQPGGISYLASGPDHSSVFDIDSDGNVQDSFDPVPNLELVGLNLDRAARPPMPMELETTLVVDVVESQTSMAFDTFFTDWASLISQESAGLSALYSPSYSYDGDDINSITSFTPGFDFTVGTPMVSLLSQESGPPEVSTVQVDATRTVTEATLNVTQNADTQFEIRLQHQPTGSNPMFLIQTQREVRNVITATTGNSPPAIPATPVLQSFEFLQTDLNPLTSLPLGGSIVVRAQVSGLLPVTGSTTEFGSVRFRLAGNDFVLQDQGGGNFSSTISLPALVAGLYAPTVVVENRRLAGPGDFLNTASASVAESREMQGAP